MHSGGHGGPELEGRQGATEKVVSLKERIAAKEKADAEAKAKAPGPYYRSVLARRTA